MEPCVYLSVCLDGLSSWQSSHFSFPSAGITDMHSQAWLCIDHVEE